MDVAQLYWGLLFGSIGFGFFLYGKRKKRIVALVSGLSLMAYPYFVSNTLIMVGIGVTVTAIPFFIRR